MFGDISQITVYEEGQMEAILTSSCNFTLFPFGGRITSFRNSPRLERYIKVLQWDK